MGTPNPSFELSLQVELCRAGSEPISGRLRLASGDWRCFMGWIGLVSAMRELAGVTVAGVISPNGDAR